FQRARSASRPLELVLETATPCRSAMPPVASPTPARGEIIEQEQNGRLNVKAVVIHKPGAPEELVMAEVPEPSPGAGEVLVDVAFAGCNWADTQIRTGVYPHPSILVDKTGSVVGKYRKVHLPGHADHRPNYPFQHLEKRYFEPGDLGFPVWRALGGNIGMCICNDRRWPETYRVMGAPSSRADTSWLQYPDSHSVGAGL